MDFCHALASQGVAFSFSLSVGSDFSSSLDAREKKQTTPAVAAEVLLKRKSDKEKHGRGGILTAPAQSFTFDCKANLN